MHDSGSKFQIIVRLDTLFGDGFCNAFAVPALELTSEQVSEPSLKEWYDTPHEEKPHTPSRGPNATTRTFADRASVESIIDQVFQVFRHSHLSHQLRVEA